MRVEGVVRVLVRRRRLRIAAVLALAAAVSACVDNGPPSMEQQLRDQGLPLDMVMSVDQETEVMVRLNDGRPELMIFTPHRFGGSEMKPWPADRPTVNGGEVGDARSPRESNDEQRVDGLGWEYLFGAGQGWVGDVVVDEPEARAQVVNPDIGGWVIVVPETVEIKSLRWKLMGADGRTLFQATGAGLPADNLMVVDDHTSVAVQVRDGEPQLLIFTPNEFGGFNVETRRADLATVGEGKFGVGSSLGPDGKSMTGHRYLFGAGQGPIQGLVVNPEARTSIVNPAVDGWVIVVPKGVPFDALEWQLLGPDGTVIFDATGIDAATRSAER